MEVLFARRFQGARARSAVRGIVSFPQPAMEEESRPIGKSLVRAKRRLHPRSSDYESALAMSTNEVSKARERKRLHGQIWRHMCHGGGAPGQTSAQDWNQWEQTFALFRERKIPYDEVTYTLLLHGYVLSHRHRSENAFLVLEEMRRCGFVHGALIRLNERWLNAFFMLADVDARPIPPSWQNVTRLCFHCARRYQKKRVQHMRARLTALSPNELLQLTQGDVRKMYLSEIEQSQAPPLLLEGGEEEDDDDDETSPTFPLHEEELLPASFSSGVGGNFLPGLPDPRTAEGTERVRAENSFAYQPPDELDAEDVQFLREMEGDISALDPAEYEK